MTITAGIELHPENGRVPHVVIIANKKTGARLWFAYATREDAEKRLPHLANGWSHAWDSPVKLVEPVGY